MKKSAITFTILIVVTTGILFCLMEANIAYQSHQKVQVDDYPYSDFDTLHNRIIVDVPKLIDSAYLRSVHRGDTIWNVKAIDLNQEDIK